MSAEEYFAIALPTDADFKRWTRSFFRRIEETHKRIARRFPDLYKLEPGTKDLPLWN